MARFTRLANELRTMQAPELDGLIARIEDENYPVETLVADLQEARLGFFAAKLSDGYYNDETPAEEVPAEQPQEPAPEAQVENQGTEERPITEVNPEEHPNIDPNVQETPAEEAPEEVAAEPQVIEDASVPTVIAESIESQPEQPANVEVVSIEVSRPDPDTIIHNGATYKKQQDQ